MIVVVVVVVADKGPTTSSKTVVFAENIMRSCINIASTSGDQDTQTFYLTIMEPRFNLSTHDLPVFRVGSNDSAVVKVEPEPDVWGIGESLNEVCLDTMQSLIRASCHVFIITGSSNQTLHTSYQCLEGWMYYYIALFHVVCIYYV